MNISSTVVNYHLRFDSFVCFAELGTKQLNEHVGSVVLLIQCKDGHYNLAN